MPDQDATVRITAVDHCPDAVFVTFSNDTTVTYHAGFLYSAREQNSNSVISTERDLPRMTATDPTEKNFR